MADLNDSSASGASDDINVDELLSEMENPAPEREMTGQPEKEAEAVPVFDGKTWEFEWNGKKVVPDSHEKAKIWMSQGYNYSQRMGELNKTQAQMRAEFEAQKRQFTDLEKRLSPYSKVDDYARQNPQWWSHVLKQYQEAQSKGQLAGGLDPILQEKLAKYDEYFQNIEQQKVAEREQKEDQTLDQEVQSIRKELANIDFNAIDPETGKTLEHRILEHASTMFGHLPAYREGVFRAATRDYLHSHLIEQARTSGKEELAKTQVMNAKKGILGKSPAPLKGIQKAQVRGKSYNDLAQEALRELGLT